MEAAWWTAIWPPTNGGLAVGAPAAGMDPYNRYAIFQPVHPGDLASMPRAPTIRAWLPSCPRATADLLSGTIAPSNGSVTGADLEHGPRNRPIQARFYASLS